MSLSDPIADALTAIRNANRTKKERVDLKASKMLAEMLRILKEEKFIYDFRLIDDKKQGVLRVYLRKATENLRKITQIVRISRPGLRVYTNKETIPVVLNGLGICILSTPQGILSGDQAKKKSVGGEIIAKVW